MIYEVFRNGSLTLAVGMGLLCFYDLRKELFISFSGQVLLNLSFHLINT
jgi:hypothetical protein